MDEPELLVLLLCVRDYLEALENPVNPLMKNLMPSHNREVALANLIEAFDDCKESNLVESAEQFFEDFMKILDKADELDKQ